MDLKAKIADIKSALSSLKSLNPKALFEPIVQRFSVMLSPQNRATFCLGMFFIFTSFYFAGASTAHLLTLLHHDTPEQTKHHEAIHQAREEAKHAPEGGGLFVQAIPDEIVSRQDKVEEEDKDLKEPDLKAIRGLASITEQPPIAPYNPYIEFQEIISTTMASSLGGEGARVATDIAFEVERHEVMAELTRREQEVRFLVTSLVAERSRDQLRSLDGQAKLKQDIFKEINFILKDGRIKDVLFSTFVIR